MVSGPARRALALVDGISLAVRVNSVTQERGQNSTLKSPHASLFHRLGVIPAADVQRSVDREKQQLLDGSPVDVAGLAAPAFSGLGNGPFRGDDYVAEMGPQAWRQRKSLLEGGGYPGVALTICAVVVLGERLRREEWE